LLPGHCREGYTFQSTPQSKVAPWEWGNVIATLLEQEFPQGDIDPYHSSYSLYRLSSVTSRNLQGVPKAYF
jgi:hypothetical protein